MFDIREGPSGRKIPLHHLPQSHVEDRAPPQIYVRTRSRIEKVSAMGLPPSLSPIIAIPYLTGLAA